MSVFFAKILLRLLAVTETHPLKQRCGAEQILRLEYLDAYTGAVRDPECLRSLINKKETRMFRSRILLAGTLGFCVVGCGGGSSSTNSNSPPTYAVGGTVSGLSGTGLTLRNNGGNDAVVNGNGSFSFSTQLSSGAAYNVTIQTQPTGQPAQSCTVANASGTVGTAAVTNINISCRELISKFVYVPNAGEGTVSGYSVDAATGALTPLSGSPFTRPQFVTGFSTMNLAWSPTSPFLLVVGSSIGSPGSTALFDYQIDAATGALKLVSDTPTGIAGSNTSVRFHPSGKFLYASSGPSALTSITGIFGFKFNTETGQVAPISTFMPLIPNMLVSDSTFAPDGNFLFVSRYASQIPLGGFLLDPQILSYQVDSTTGLLTPGNSSSQLTGMPGSMTVDPSGQYLLVSNYDLNLTTPTANNVRAYGISATTGLGSAIGSPQQTGRSPSRPFFNNDGTRVYVGYFGATSPALAAGGIAAFSFDKTAGLLTAVEGSPVTTTGATASGASINPNGKFITLTNSTSGTLTVFAVTPDSGKLTQISGSPFAPAVGTTPGTITIDPSGNYAYVADRITKSISSYKIDPVTGAMTYINSQPTGTSPGTSVVFGLQ